MMLQKLLVHVIHDMIIDPYHDLHSISFSEARFRDSLGKFEDTTHVYKYTLDGQVYFVELTDEEHDLFEDKYNVCLSYWRD